MPITPKDIQIIEAHLLGNLDAQEQEYFESRQGDVLFEREIKDQKILQEVISDKGHKKIKTSLQDLESALGRKKGIIHLLRTNRIWQLAASILLIVGAATLIILNQPNYQDIHRQYYSPYPNIVDPITKGDANDSYSVYQLYELRKYNDALNVLSKSIEINNTEKWYKTQSLIAMNDPDAIRFLKEFVQDSSNEYHDASQWYMALEFLEQGRVKKTKLLLDEINNNPDHSYYRIAIRLVDELQR